MRTFAPSNPATRAASSNALRAAGGVEGGLGKHPMHRDEAPSSPPPAAPFSAAHARSLHSNLDGVKRSARSAKTTEPLECRRCGYHKTMCYRLRWRAKHHTNKIQHHKTKTQKYMKHVDRSDSDILCSSIEPGLRHFITPAGHSHGQKLRPAKGLWAALPLYGHRHSSGRMPSARLAMGIGQVSRKGFL